MDFFCHIYTQIVGLKTFFVKIPLISSLDWIKLSAKMEISLITSLFLHQSNSLKGGVQTAIEVTSLSLKTMERYFSLYLSGFD